MSQVVGESMNRVSPKPLTTNEGNTGGALGSLASSRSRSNSPSWSDAIAPMSPSICKTLQYVEWTFLLMVIFRILLLLLNKPLGYTMDGDDYLSLSVIGMFAILSVFPPVHRPRWQRQLYIAIEIICLLISRAFSEWELDLLLYLVLVKSCFLLPRRDVIFTTIAAGVSWQLGLTHHLLYRFSVPVEEMRVTLEGLLEIPKHLVVLDLVIHSTFVYIALSLLVVLLSMTVLAERKSRQQAAELSKEVEALAADLERTRIARDIHDSLGHTLTTLDVQLEVAQTLQTQDPERAAKALATAKSLSNQSLQDVRRAVSTMRYGHFNLPAALNSLVEQMKQTQPLNAGPFQVETQINLPNLPLQVSQQLFLIMKEGLTNIQKHSQASVVKLWAQTTQDAITVGLSDNGVGFSPDDSSPGFGLRGMQERVQLLDGKMSVRSAAGQGTLIQVTIPQ